MFEKESKEVTHRQIHTHIETQTHTDDKRIESEDHEED